MQGTVEQKKHLLLMTQLTKKIHFKIMMGHSKHQNQQNCYAKLLDKQHFDQSLVQMHSEPMFLSKSSPSFSAASNGIRLGYVSMASFEPHVWFVFIVCGKRFDGYSIATRKKYIATCIRLYLYTCIPK